MVASGGGDSFSPAASSRCNGEDQAGETDESVQVGELLELARRQNGGDESGEK